MDELRRKVRDWLQVCTKNEFYMALQEAKINPRQFVICEKRFVDGLLNYQIGMEMNISDKTVEREVARAYDALFRVLEYRIAKSPWGVRLLVHLKGFFCLV